MQSRHVVITSAIVALGSVIACSSASESGFDLVDSGEVDASLGDGDTVTRDGSHGGNDAPSFGNSDAPFEVGGPTDASLFNDGAPDVGNADGACVAGDAGAPPHPQKCAPSTAIECDGPTDAWINSMGLDPSFKNGSVGNGFDDDCDGQVDEGCTCPGNGQTKTCYLVPPTQADAQSHAPVGWCTDNSKGSLDCAGNEFPKWSGVCRGAQPPYAHDVCAPGDFNCDGLQQNSDQMDCTCKPITVTCPTTPITEQPYPDATKIQLIDGSQWIDANDRPNATNWTWTVIGGDCDNVLPFPTYAIYTQTNSTAPGARIGGRTPVKFDPTLTPARYVATAGQPLISVQAANGNGVTGGQVFPAFGLSGDYIVQGEFDLNGEHYSCTQKVEVRAPGIRAELCWDTVGGDGAVGGNDIDLHFAQLQYKGAAANCAKKGWDSTCILGNTYEDCWWDSISGCRSNSTAPGPDWGYTDSAESACIGWSSKRDVPSAHALGCTNPRLDKDNITCDTSVDDPTSDSFCGPENINLDNPRDNDSFVVAVNHFEQYKLGSSSANAKPHVNLYCNGQRVISIGYNPVAGQTSFPLLKTPGADTGGDYWIVGSIKAHVANGQITGCDVAAIPSHHPDPTRDGAGNGVCVESKANVSTPAYAYKSHAFVENSALQGVPNNSVPALPAEWCKH